MLSEKPWKVDAVLLLMCGLLLSLFAGTTVMMLLERLVPHETLANQKFYNFIISTVSFQVVGLFLADHFLKQHHMNWKEFLGLNSTRLKRAVGLAVLAGLLVVPLTLCLSKVAAWVMTLFHQTPKEQPTILVLHETAGVGQRICFGVAAILVAPVVEEIVFRGILYPLVKQRGHPMLALAGTSLLFAAIHYNLMTFVPLTFLAMALVWLYEETDTLVAPILAHSLFNAVNFFMFFLTPS